MSSSPSEHNMVAAWDTYAPAFQDEVREYKNEETNRLLQETLAAFRESLVAHQSNAYREDDSTPTPQPDFKKLRTDCEAIFADNLPAFQVPSAKNLLTGFFMTLLAATLMIMGLGVVGITGAYIWSLLGVITIASFNFKGLAVTAAIGGSLAASVVAVSMFSPAKVAGFHLNNFVKKVEPPAETPAFQA